MQAGDFGQPAVMNPVSCTETTLPRRARRRTKLTADGSNPLLTHSHWANLMLGDKNMRNILAVLTVLVPLAACSQTEQGAAVGGLGGAAIGAAVARNPVQGAVVGGAVGAVAGALIGRANEPDRCRYRDRYGRVYVAACPNGY